MNFYNEYLQNGKTLVKVPWKHLPACNTESSSDNFSSVVRKIYLVCKIVEYVLKKNLR